MSSKMVRLYEVGIQYAPGRYALKDVSFELDKGEFAYITGLNGAGKTSLLKVLFAMSKATEGKILVNNRDISALPKKGIFQYRREVGFVFQDFRLLPDATVADNVRLPLEIRSMTKSEMEYRVHGVLSLVGLQDRMNDFPMDLSGGEQQRIAIARSIVGNPMLLLADEPTGNLDSRTSREIMALFQEIHDMGTTVLIATHDETLISEFPGRVLELERGRLSVDKPPVAKGETTV